jgi:hypothetical protein
MKRITLYLPDSVDVIKKRLEADFGIQMTYVQVFSFLMHFYLKPAYGDDWVPLYTTPSQRTWVGLTNDEVNNFAAGCHLGKSVQGAIYEAVAKLKEKNT